MFIGEYYIENGNLCETASCNLPSAVPAGSVYEVLRVMDGVPLFWNDHFSRLQHSWEHVSQLPLRNEGCFRSDFIKLKAANNFQDGNLRIICFPTTGEVMLGAVPAFYPEKQMYLHGIHTEILLWERVQPDLKIGKPNLTKLAEQKRNETKAYEMLLVNQVGQFTEGSRSNLFFIKNNSAITAPTATVLAGITRAHVLKACTNIGLHVEERLLYKDEVQDCQAAFITGTSPKVLPIKSIANVALQIPNTVVESVMHEYDSLLELNIAQNRELFA